MPPTAKPQTKKKAGEVKAKKAVVVAAALLLLLVAAFVEAQNVPQPGQNAQAGDNRATAGNATKVVDDITGWTVGGLGLVVTFFGATFWAAVGIAIFHIAVSYLAPTRFQRLGAMWDAVERMKDVAIGLAVLFAVFYGVVAAGAIISGNFSTELAWRLFVAIVSKPLVDLYNQIIGTLTPQTASPPGG